MLAGCFSTQPPSLIIEHVNVVDVRQGVVFTDLTIALQGSRILYIDSTGWPVSDAVQTVDGRGKYLMPGLWDMHVHADTSDLPGLLAWGVTGVRDMGGAVAPRAALAHRIDRGELAGPHLIYGGPMIAGRQAVADDDTWRVTTGEEAARAVSTIASLGGQFVKVHEGVTREMLLAVLSAAHSHNLRVVGHMPADMDPVEAARAGMASIEHLEFVPESCTPLFHPGPRPSGCAPDKIDSLLGRLGRTGVWLDPTISSFRVWVTPALYQSIASGFHELVPVLRRNNARLLTGTDLGDARIIPGESLHDEMALLVAAGFTPAEVLRAATSNAVDFLGLADSLGTIEPGKVADLVLLDANPLEDIAATRRIALVIRNGVVAPR